MASEAAMLLDELMGRTRNVLPGKDAHEMEWWDSEVCKSFLCGFCPCDLFTNTRADIGTCDKIHDEKLRQKYQESERAWKMSYEVQFLSELEKLVRSLDRRITHGRERLRRSADAKQKQMSGLPEDGGSDKLRNLNMDINSRVMRLEELGQRGEVEGAQVLLREVESLERERERERQGLVRDSSKTLAGFEVDANDFHEKMELCDVCGSFLVIGDSQSRVDAHLLGKQHLGYARIRASITELKTKLAELRTLETESRRRTDSNGRRLSQDYKHRRSRSRSKDRHRRSRSRSKDRHRRSRSRSKDRHRRSRSRSKDRHRRSGSRSKDWHRRSRSREQRRRSRSRERKRKSRSRERRHRSRSRERKHRSRSRERKHRSRSRERKHRSRSRDRAKEKNRVEPAAKEPQATSPQRQDEMTTETL